jgi:hypothetical protein
MAGTSAENIEKISHLNAERVFDWKIADPDLQPSG